MSRVAQFYSEIVSNPLRVDFAGGYMNYGLWSEDTKTPAEASQKLVDDLLSRLPETGNVLDVAFGQGVSTKQLCDRYGSKNVIGINIGADQLQLARKRGVDCELRVMDAAKPDFPSESFDAILCIEAAFHFRSRASFLSEAYRLLRPNGVLVVSDVLFSSGHGLDPEVFPPENQVASVEQYRTLYDKAGFSRTATSLTVSTRRQIYPLSTAFAGQFDFFRGEGAGAHLDNGDASSGRGSNPFAGLERITAHFIVSRILNIEECVLVSARK